MSRLDREAKEEYMLEIMVKDGGIPTAKKVLLVYSCVSLSMHYRAADGGQPAVIRMRIRCSFFSLYVVVLYLVANK